MKKYCCLPFFLLACAAAFTQDFDPKRLIVHLGGDMFISKNDDYVSIIENNLNFMFSI